MNLAITSDIHLDYIVQDGKILNKQRFNMIIDALNSVEADYLILAGDICSLNDAEMVFPLIKPKVRKVLYVTGNHCYCGVDISYRPSMPDNFVMLEAGNVFECFDGIKIAGDTLWSNIGIAYEWEIRNSLIEYFQVRNGDRMLVPFDVNELNKKAKKALLESGADIIISHHPPSWRSANPVYQDSRLNDAFYNNLDLQIEDSSIKLWIHGHTHYDVDYTIGNCRVAHHCWKDSAPVKYIEV